MKGHMLKKEDYAALMSCATVQDAAGYLRSSTPYRDVLSHADINTVHRGLLENLLRKNAFMTYIRITGFEQLNKQEFYNFRIIWAEIQEILRIIRFINAGSDGYINDAPMYINDYISFDLLDLAQVKSFEELAAFFGKKGYGDVLRRFVPQKGEKADYTACEMALRRQYYSRIMKSADKFDDDISGRLKELIGTHNDLTNIINSYRMKLYFHEDDEHISEMMLPYGRITSKKLPELYEYADAERFASQLSKTKYGRFMKQRGIEGEEFESAVFRLKYLYARRALSISQDAPLSVYAFSYLADNEVSNIIRVIESIRYNMPQSETERLLVI